jgi:predicted nucleic acid-binding protein
LIRSLVLDANILIRAVLGSRVPAILTAHRDERAFVTPTICFDDATTHLPVILTKHEIDPTDALARLAELANLIRPVPEPAYAAAKTEALARISSRDPDDWPILALALTLDCAIWTEDQDFFGTGVPTWTTDRVELYFRNTPTHEPSTV